jgi:hypothetical protein
MLKKKKKRKGLRVLLVLTLLQWGGLYGVNTFLAPESSVVPAVAKSAFDSAQPEVKAPDDADQFRISDDKKLLAYTKGKDLFLENKDGEMYHKNVGRVTYFQWLGKSNSLLYFVQSDSLTGYILQASTLKTHLLESWPGTDRKIKQAYFNPYMEFLYIETERSRTDEIYKYDAVNGFYKFPLPELKIDRIDFDEKTDTMEITDSEARLWEYKNGRLYDPKGKLTELTRIKVASPSDDTKKDVTKKDSNQQKTDSSNVKNTTSKETSTKDTPAKDTTSSTKMTDSNQNKKESSTSTDTPATTPVQKETTGGIEPPTLNQTPREGTTTTVPSRQSTTKETVPPNVKTQ